MDDWAATEAALLPLRTLLKFHHKTNRNSPTFGYYLNVVPTVLQLLPLVVIEWGVVGISAC
jgi:hypothetical protein